MLKFPIEPSLLADYLVAAVVCRGSGVAGLVLPLLSDGASFRQIGPDWESRLTLMRACVLVLFVQLSEQIVLDDPVVYLYNSWAVLGHDGGALRGAGLRGWPG